MNLRFLSRVARNVTRIPTSIKCRASNPKNVIQRREMSKMKEGDGTTKEPCCDDGQFFSGCFKKTEKPKCPVKKLVKKGACNDKCDDGHCKPE